MPNNAPDRRWATIKLHFTTRRWELTEADRKVLQHHLEKLERQLRHFDPDAVDLYLDVERHPRRDEYLGSVRLFIFNEALPAKRNAAPTPRAFLNRAFQDLEEQLARFKSKLRREYTHERKRQSMPPEAVRFRERELMEERELLDRALVGDRAAFEQLVESELPALARIVRSALAEVGRDATEEVVQHVMADVLTKAFQLLARKPARWSLLGWLGWLARREIAQEAKELAVAQSAEPPAID